MRSPDQIGITWEENQLLMQRLRDKAALENRRQHNIFEVGEKVVLNTGSRIYKIDHIYKKAVWLDSGKDQLDVVNIDDIIRHATDAEIEAGKRLEVNQ